MARKCNHKWVLVIVLERCGRDVFTGIITVLTGRVWIKSRDISDPTARKSAEIQTPVTFTQHQPFSKMKEREIRSVVTITS
jgi:ABC-type branched-subunit amino acid transport system ATPase component